MTDFINITSKDNPLIKLVSSLQTSSKARRENGLFVLEGLRICRDALENDIVFEKLIVSKTAFEKQKEQVEIFGNKAKKSYILADSLFEKICDTNSPQGIIVLAQIPKAAEKIDVCGKYIALENLQDPANLGAVSRTAEALGISGIILSSGCDPFAPKSLRASMGTLLRMPLFQVKDLIEFIKDNGLKSFGCVVDDTAKPITDVKFCGGTVVIIGNEANGLTDYTKSNVDSCITIPMSGNAESLNAAVAAAISMWEMVK